jgi:hypothetical protein
MIVERLSALSMSLIDVVDFTLFRLVGDNTDDVLIRALAARHCEHAILTSNVSLTTFSL